MKKKSKHSPKMGKGNEQAINIRGNLKANIDLKKY